MELQSFLSQHRTSCGVEANSKKRALEALSQLIAQDQPNLNADEIFLNFTARERLGSTGIGTGVAIPHCRTNNCIGIVGALIQLKEPIDYDAVDGQPVDILFALIVPEEEHDAHLQTLAAIVERLTQPSYLQALREAKSPESLFAAAISEDISATA